MVFVLRIVGEFRMFGFFKKDPSSSSKTLTLTSLRTRTSLMKTYSSIRRLCLTLALGLAAAPLTAQPCSFAWNSLKLTNGTTKNYSTPLSGQPYQGPCMAYAVVAAMESMYEIEHDNPNSDPNMSEAWIDYLTYGLSDWRQILEVNQTGIPEDACGNFAPGCQDEQFECHLIGQVRPLTQEGSCFDISKEFNESTHVWEWVVTPQSSNGMGWYYAGSVNDNLSVQDAVDLKNHIMNGPIALVINQASNISKFGNYNTSGVSYHAVTLIGWKDIGTCTQWLIKDSWPGMPAFAYTKADPGIPTMLASGDAEAWQMSDISYQANTGGPISSPGSSWPDYNAYSQCVPPPGITGNLNCWNAGADKGGCMSASGSMNGTTVTWQISGSNGYLFNTTGSCTEIVGSNFTGTLTGTATDGCGRTVTKSCYFPRSGGPGGGSLPGPQ
ncbi:MAG: hypothetical protein GY719_23430 [bacterium]|nr:hypothetical protein [bacterium]